MSQKPEAPRWDAIVVGAMAAILVAAIGGSLTEIGPWYHSLVVPSWKPPDWAFGPIWTVILALCVVAGVRGYSGESDSARRQAIIGLFALNGCLNIVWSLLFFKLHRPDWALIEAGFFWLSILALIVLFGTRARASSLLLAPYLVWVTIATYLNYRIVLMNGPFG